MNFDYTISLLESEVRDREALAKRTVTDSGKEYYEKQIVELKKAIKLLQS